MINNIRIFLVNDNVELCESNQQYIGIKELFRGYIAKVWHGTKFALTKYQELNKIIIKECIAYYMKYWQHRKEKFHEENY